LSGAKDWVLGRVVPAIGEAGRRSEQIVGGRIGAVQTPASGAGSKKGDLQLPHFRIEAKSSKGKTIGVAYHWLIKILQEARLAGFRPALHLQFTWPDGRSKGGGSWVAVPEADFMELVEAAGGKIRTSLAGADLDVVPDSSVPEDEAVLKTDGSEVRVEL